MALRVLDQGRQNRGELHSHRRIRMSQSFNPAPSHDLWGVRAGKFAIQSEPGVSRGSRFCEPRSNSLHLEAAARTVVPLGWISRAVSALENFPTKTALWAPGFLTPNNGGEDYAYHVPCEDRGAKEC